MYMFKRIFSLMAPVLWASRAMASEAEIRIPDLGSTVSVFGMTGHTLLSLGLIIAVLGLVFA